MVNVVQAYKVVRINKQAKEVEPNGHGERTCIHKLYLHELASVVPRFSSPNSPPMRLGHEGLDLCR